MRVFIFSCFLHSTRRLTFLHIVSIASFVLGTKSLLRIFLMRSVFDVRNNCRRYVGARGKRKFDFSRSEMNENWNHGLSTICVRHDSMKSKAKMPLLFSYLSLRGLWLGRKCRFKMKIAMIFTLPPACVHILFICMWEAGMKVSLRSALSTLGDGVWIHEKNNRKVKWRKVVNFLAIEIRTKDAHMYTQSEAKKCGISEIPFFVMLLMFIVVHFMMFSAESGLKSIQYFSEKK